MKIVFFPLISFHKSIWYIMQYFSNQIFFINNLPLFARAILGFKMKLDDCFARVVYLYIDFLR